MFRYLALIWDERQASPASERAMAALLCTGHKWRCVLRTAGLLILEAGADQRTACSQVLGQDSGALLGRVFMRGDVQARGPSTLTEWESEVIVATAGRSLLKRCWGRYVAIVRDSSDRCTRILRDPCGGLPCFVSFLRELTVVFSHVEDVCVLDEFQPSINWEYVSAHALLAPLHTHETALREVSELQAGECLEIRDGRHSRMSYWNAMSFARSEPIEDVAAAVEILGTTTRMCVQRWGSCHRDVVLNLSGLDSNIVLRCLTRDGDGPRTTCLNFFSDGPEEDEREFVRAGARAAGCGLVEHRRDAQGVKLERILGLRPCAKPAFGLYALQYGEVEAAVAQHVGASALFTGYGGDALFYQSGGRLAAADYAVMHGFGKDLWRIADEASRVDRVSVWEVLGCMARAVLWGQPVRWFGDIEPEESLVTPEVIDVVRGSERFLSAYLEDSEGIPEGKRWHALGMSRVAAPELALAFPHAVERIAPLMSQPLIEVCLRIPAWVMIAGGWDRAIARRAFARELPRKIVRRRLKGGSTDTLRKVFANQLGFIRELMLGGEMVRRGILDQGKVEACLTEDGVSAGRARTELLVQHVSTEAWLRSWRGGYRRQVA